MLDGNFLASHVTQSPCTLNAHSFCTCTHNQASHSVACTSTPPCLRFSLVPVEAGMGAVPTKAARTRAFNCTKKVNHVQMHTGSSRRWQGCHFDETARRGHSCNTQMKCTCQTSSKRTKRSATRAKIGRCHEGQTKKDLSGHIRILLMGPNARSHPFLHMCKVATPHKSHAHWLQSVSA